MLYIVYAIHVLICLFLILVVLLQQGSGADLSVFGGGGTQTAFGARSATNLLHKLTVAGFVGFILTTITIGFLKTGSGDSVMSEVEQTSPVDAVEEAADGAPAEDEAFPATSEVPVDASSEDAESVPVGGETGDPSGDNATSDETDGP